MESKKTIHNSIIQPHYTYASTLLYIATKHDLGRFQLLQNKSMRIILGENRFVSIERMLSKLKWLDVEGWIKYSTLVFLYKMKSNSSRSYLKEITKQFEDVHNRDTRNKRIVCIDNKNSKKKSKFNFP